MGCLDEDDTNQDDMIGKLQIPILPIANHSLSIKKQNENLKDTEKENIINEEPWAKLLGKTFREKLVPILEKVFDNQRWKKSWKHKFEIYTGKKSIDSTATEK